MSRIALCIFCVLCATCCVDSARILGVYPMPSISHQVVFRALTLELAKRGHELVVMTPNPALPKERPPDNITEIDTSESYQELLRMIHSSEVKNLQKRGVIVEPNNISDFIKSLQHLVMHHFDLPVVKSLLEDNTQKFDLVIVEAIMNYPLIVGKIFTAPVIQFSSLYGSPELYELMGSPAWHPNYYPSLYKQRFRNFGLWDQIYEIFREWTIYRAIKSFEEIENNVIKQRHGEDAPTVAELQKNVHMVFLNAHPIFSNNRPVPPNVIHLGGLHLQPVQPLPEDLKLYLDNSKRGVIYVSLGTNVRPSMMDQEFLEVFLDTFKALPYDILWKFDGDSVHNVSDNVRYQKWFPQRDLLFHPNIKLFVMQGGLQSTDEAIEAAVPLVGIPILGDQWYNVNKFIDFGVGVHVDAATMTAHDLIGAINEVLGDDRYKENMKKLRAIIKDQPQTPLERAVWWTEHVIRHHGGMHLRAASAHKTWNEYYMVDALLTVMGGVTVSLIIMFIVVRKILSSLRISVNLKSKQS